MKTRKYWNDADLDFLRNNYKNFNAEELSDHFGVSRSAITNQLTMHKIYKNGVRRPNTNVSFLSENSLELFYWTGFLLADGNFRTTNRKNDKLNSLRLAVSIKDIEHIKKFANHINANVIIKNNYRKNGFSNDTSKEYKLAWVNANDKELIPIYCTRFDIKHDKTHNPPDFSKYSFTSDQFISLIIGYIDGDGSVCVNDNQTQIELQVHINWANNLEIIQDFIYRFCELNKTTKLLYLPHRLGGSVKMSLGRKHILKTFKDFIDENNLPVLNRKWDKISGARFES